MNEQARKPVPLVKAYDPPPEPPDVELLRGRGGQANVVQRGVRYAGEWIVDGKLERGPEPLPMPWPEAVAVEEDSSLFVSFGPVPSPEFIEVRIFGEALDADGTPTPDQPMATVECALSDPDGKGCIEIRGGNVGVALQVPPGGVRHITAWASWNVPLRLSQRLGIDTGDVHSAWLFKALV